MKGKSLTFKIIFLKNIFQLRRSNWTLYSTCNLWQQLVDDTKEEAKQRGITAEVYGNHIASSITARCSSLQKITKKVIFLLLKIFIIYFF